MSETVFVGESVRNRLESGCETTTPKDISSDYSPTYEYSDPETDSEEGDFFDDADQAGKVASKLPDTIMTAIQEADEFTIPSETFSIQTEITVVLRMAIVDWMIRVVTKVKLHRPTLYNAVYILDTVLSQKPVSRDDLHLLAASCLWTSTKVEETLVPNTSLAMFTKICQNKFSADDFISKEVLICPLMKGRLNYPRPWCFLEPFMEFAEMNEEDKPMVQYCLDLSLLGFDFVEIPAPVVTVAAIVASMKTFAPISKLTALIHYTGSLAEIINKMLHISWMIVEKKTSALFEIYTEQQIAEFTQRLHESVEHYSAKNV